MHWALGDAGTALEAGKNLKTSQFPTQESKSRMHTDLARAHWLLGQPEQTADQLLAALRYSPAEERDRPAIRNIVTQLRQRHPRAAGVRELAAATKIPA
ncbi:hypothetical protein [Streptomyces sp. YS-3]|uniref:hypothetical protein n=1 Tax=Streptomyces sp. YS-3 TaxID=3381352 RepID=UPI0038627C7B